MDANGVATGAVEVRSVVVVRGWHGDYRGSYGVVVGCGLGWVDVVRLCMGPGDGQVSERVSVTDVVAVGVWGGELPGVGAGWVRSEGAVAGVDGSDTSARGQGVVEVVDGGSCLITENREGYRARCYADMMCVIGVGGVEGLVPADQEMGCVGRLVCVAGRAAGFERWGGVYLEWLFGWLFRMDSSLFYGGDLFRE